MHWAVAYHPDQVETLPNGCKRLTVPPLQIAETSLSTAIEQGWIVLGKDSDFPDSDRVDWRTLQSGAKRHPYRTDLDVSPEGREDWPDRESD